MITTALSFIGNVTLLTALIIAVLVAVAWIAYYGWIPYDANPGGNTYNDCGVRAMVKLTGKRYKEVRNAFEEIAGRMYLSPVAWTFSRSEVFEAYAKNAGYEQMHCSEYQKCVKFIDFARSHRFGKYVLIGRTYTGKDINGGHLITHAVPCINGKLYNGTDPSNYYIIGVYKQTCIIERCRTIFSRHEKAVSLQYN